MSFIDYGTWSTRLLTVDALRLDPQNPRLPIAATNLKQNKIREYLVSEEDVSSLARDIAQDGFIPFEPIFAIKDGEHFVVIEGNRRLCALQLLRDCNKAPVAKMGTFKKLAKKIEAADIEKINVIIAPSRAAARRVLYLRHIKEVKTWNRQQKNSFVAQGLGEGKTIDQIAEELNESSTSIQSALFECLLQKMFLELELPEEVENYVTSNKFNLSTLERILNTKSFKDLTKIKIDGAAITAGISPQFFKSIIRKIAIDLSRGDSQKNSRALDKLEDRDAYVEELRKLNKDADYKEGTFEYNPFQGAREQKDALRQEVVRRPPQKKLVPTGKNYRTGNPKLDRVLEVAQKFPLSNYTLAGAMLLRLIVELSVVRIFEQHGQKSKALEANGRTRGLTQNIQLLIQYGQWFSNSQNKADIERFIKSSSWESLETLNRYIHGNLLSFPDKDLLENLWPTIEVLVEICHE